MPSYDWIPEEEAAKIIGYKAETLRRYAKAGKLQVVFTSLNNRKFQYCKKSIQKVLSQNAQY